MYEIPFDIERSIRKYEPIKTEGLTLYPIQVKDYYKFLVAQKAIDFMPQKLPLELMGVPTLEAFYRLDMGLVAGHNPTGHFASSLLLLALALRLLPNGTMEEQVNMFNVVYDKSNTLRLKALRFTVNGEEICDISPVKYQRLLPIIAAQNGLELVNPDDNAELLEAEAVLAEEKAPNLKVTIEDMVHSVCALTQVEESEVDEWSILKLQDRLRTFKRIIDYIVCGIGESQGTKWKGGNPVPHPWFKRESGGTSALIDVNNFLGGDATSAINNPTDELPPEVINKF